MLRLNDWVGSIWVIHSAIQSCFGRYCWLDAGGGGWWSRRSTRQSRGAFEGDELATQRTTDRDA